MRFVDRSSVKIPIVLDGPGSKGAMEREAAIAFFRLSGNKHKAYSGFKIYKHPTVKAALLQLFNEKCAYCELNYGGAPMDVEHFRPKSAVVGLKNGKEYLKKPAYYWLAADWHNLFPSCIDCNRQRVHGQTGGLSTLMGKANKFPLEAGTIRQFRHTGDVELMERRLLLDPCRDNPAKHLRYDPKTGVVKARKLKGVISAMAIASIEAYALQRTPLVERRHAHASKLRFHIDAANRFATYLKINRLDKKSNAALRHELSAIEAFLDEKEPFLAMTKEIVRLELRCK